MKKIKRFFATLRLIYAINRADREHERTGERYYVIPVRTTGGRAQLLIMDRKNFRKLRMKRYISNKAKISDLEKECVYCTPYRHEIVRGGFVDRGMLPTSVMEYKRNMYFRFLGLD